MLNVRHLAVFRAVAKTGSVSAAARRQLAPKDIAAETLISFAEDTLTGWGLCEAFCAAGPRSHVTFTVNHTPSASTLVQAGVGLSVVDAFPMLSGIYPQLVIRPFRPLIETRPRVVSSKTRPVSMINRKFVAEKIAVIAKLIANSHSMLKCVKPGRCRNSRTSQRPWKLTTITCRRGRNQPSTCVG